MLLLWLGGRNGADSKSKTDSAAITDFPLSCFSLFLCLLNKRVAPIHRMIKVLGRDREAVSARGACCLAPPLVFSLLQARLLALAASFHFWAGVDHTIGGGLGGGGRRWPRRWHLVPGGRNLSVTQKLLRATTKTLPLALGPRGSGGRTRGPVPSLSTVRLTPGNRGGVRDKFPLRTTYDLKNPAFLL